MPLLVGVIHEINRYPVKSFAGERLETCDIEPYGMLGDRFGAFYDESKEGWKRFITARNIPNMLNYRARYEGGEVQVTAPDGRNYDWDEALLADIQSQTKTKIAMSGLRAPHPEDSRLMSVDGSSLLLITDASLKKLAATWGKELDPRRFRANFVVALSEEAMDEGDWIGKQLAIGETRLQVDSYCERCVVITMDPDTQAKDPSLLRKVNEEFGLHFGVYASVAKSGRIRLGDSVEWVL